MRVVLDANVFISALLNKKGVPAQIFNLIKTGSIQLAISAEILEEIKLVLRYPKLIKILKMNDSQTNEFISLLASISFVAPGSIKVSAISEDPSDNKYLSCAIESGSSFIISGDRHLLKLKKFKKIPIMKPADFFAHNHRLDIGQLFF